LDHRPDRPVRRTPRPVHHDALHPPVRAGTGRQAAPRDRVGHRRTGAAARRSGGGVMTGNPASAHAATGSPELTDAERRALAAWAGKTSPKLTARTGAPLARLVE